MAVCGRRYCIGALEEDGHRRASALDVRAHDDDGMKGG